jgi:hypothetical protein
MKLLCPRCGHNTTVRQTWGGERSKHIKLHLLHMLENTIMRRRRCLNCKFIFRTVELPLAPTPPPTPKALADLSTSKTRKRRRRLKAAAETKAAATTDAESMK